ncbi:Vacuolar assembly/sorting protein VPS8 [Rasamsonia emersonii CBS 393.64]|uniref:Vacuolar assembly/sorting protein VPS8 n=1 Tax=Rasamsonia emersonii (strain ATCC 16479 / CBS 393.64 / IMI 116815) TaxID=1408163 RepID=A0A0F4Z3G9_RASE3|nr:Vacuolar assembly/sorting protein VPS8 [Rasamsonia emersonii CBS 393.64]KKA25074.1 Vacuolar assembly/sorting protein VPS8 [Rasamsonia emersonii CBS 393.64]
MSSTNQGSDDGAREDELDLGQEDDELPTQTNGHVETNSGTRIDSEQEKEQEQEQDDQLIYNDAPLSVAASDDQLSQRAGSIAETETASRQGYPVRAAGGVADTASLPDDTPSLHGSLRSSPSSSAFALRGSPRLSPSPSHRPFDLRFQSRLSSSSLSSPRPSSPYLIHQHSRHSSFASQTFSSAPDSEVEAPKGPWEVVRWTKLQKITGRAFSEVPKVRTWTILLCVCATSTNYSAVECGSVMSLAISADHSTVAGGHASGDIFTWEISRAARPFLHIPPISAGQREARKSDGHISGVSVIHVGFLGTRRTALVSADDRGMAFSHLATRGMGAVGRTVKTTRILGRYPETPAPGSRPRKPSSVLAFSPLPLGNVEQPTDGLGLVAMLTPYLLVIVSTTPIAQTQYKSPRPKEVASHGVMTAALAWFPAIKLKGRDDTSKTKLVYCWSNVLTVLEVSEAEPEGEPGKDRPPVLDFRPRSRWRAKEAIVAVQWLSRSVLAVLTVTQQLLILEDPSLPVTESFDLLHKHIYHVDLFSSQLHTLVEQYNEEDPSMHGVVGDAFYPSFRAYKGRLFLLGYNDLSVGSLSNWADRLLAYMEAGDFVAAIRLATSYYRGDAEKLTVGLPEEDELRHSIVRERLLEMMSASLKYAFGRNQEASTERLGKSQLEDLADASIAACICMGDYDFLWDEVYNWYEEHDSEAIFLDVLEPSILQGAVRSLPPTALKALINHYATNHTSSRLEEIICLLDPTTMDIEQVTTLCKQHNLYDAFIYVWNRTLGDYIGPLQELLELAGRVTEPLVNGDAAADGGKNYDNAMKMFPYLSFILTGRIYPTGEEMEEDEATKAKTALYTYLFSGGHSSALDAKPIPHQRQSFASLRAILEFDAPSFMSMLNEAFEDSFLNDSAELTNGDSSQALDGLSAKGLTVNRQYLVSILLEVMSAPPFGPAETIYLDMFIARNLPKYPQYVLLSGTTLHQVLERLCQYPSEEMAEDCELSVEYLLSVYRPPDIQSLIPLFKEARFFRVLKSTYRSERQFPELILVYLEDKSGQDLVFSCIHDCLRPGSGLSTKQQRDVLQVVKSHAGELARINVSKAAQTVQQLAPALHESFLRALDDDEYKQFHYLGTLLEPEIHSTTERNPPAKWENWMVERYVQLLCRYNPSHVADFVDALRVGDLRLEEVLPAMEGSGVVDAAVILLARQGQVRSAMDRLIGHLGTLESGLAGILRNAGEAPDSASTAEAIGDLLESLDKYTRVGTWLCQGQTKSSKRVRNGIPSSSKRGSTALQQPLSFEENLWLDLIDTVVRIARNVSSLLRDAPSAAGLSSKQEGDDGAELTSALRRLVQQVFTALLTSTTKAGGPSSSERTDVSFLRILRAFLTRAASWSPSLSELRAVLASIFSAYTYEESLLALANGMLDKDLFVHVDEVTKLRQRGWRPRGQVCEICRRRVWGPGAGGSLWEAWERRQVEENRRLEAKRLASVDAQGKGKRPSQAGVDEQQHPFGEGEDSPERGNDAEHELGPVVIFACRHLYHQQCLANAPGPRSEHDPNQDNRGHRSHALVRDPGRELTCPVCT